MYYERIKEIAKGKVLLLLWDKKFVNIHKDIFLVNMNLTIE